MEHVASSHEQDVSMTITKAIGTSREEGEILITSCCSQQCLQNLIAKEVLKIYVHFKVLNAVQKWQWIIDKLNKNTCCNSKQK